MSVRIVLLVLGALFALYKVFGSPKHYFKGLFLKPNDQNKTEGIYILLFIFILIAVPAHFIMGVAFNALDPIAVILMAIAFVWKSVEILRDPKTYFSFLNRPDGNGNFTSKEPLGLMIFSAVVIASYFLK